MLNVKVRKDDPTDLYEQVAAEIRRAIADGEAKPGERLPPAKDLAAILGVNSNTVLRSLRLLRDEGLLQFRLGRGISVAGTPERGAVVQRARELIEFARQQGYRRDELIEIIQDADEDARVTAPLPHGALGLPCPRPGEVRLWPCRPGARRELRRVCRTAPVARQQRGF